MIYVDCIKFVKQNNPQMVYVRAKGCMWERRLFMSSSKPIKCVS